MTNFYKLLLEKPFTFYVGPTKLPFQVHAGILEGFSKPLYRMTSSSMKESHDRYATLPEADPEAFALLCEYAYTRAYRLPVEEPPIEDNFTFQNEDLEHYKPLLGEKWHCRFCGWENSTECGDFFPFCNSDCQWDAKAANSPSCANQSHHCTGCCELLSATGPYIYTMSPLCKKCEGVTELPLYPLVQEHTQLVDFESHSNLSNRVNQYLSGTSSKCGAFPSLLSLAKLFVLGDMYRVEDLTKYSLCCIYSDLVSREVYGRYPSELLLLLQYTYNTDGAGAESCEDGISLKGIVAMYTEKYSDALRHLDGFAGYIPSAINLQN